MPCFGRENETLELWRRFNSGQNLLMLAPRRIGKTVLLNQLCEMAPKQGYRAIVLDVEGFHDEKDFFRQCCSAIQEELSTGASVMTAFTHRLTRLLQGSAAEGADWRQLLMHTDWQEFADQLFTHLNDNKEEPPWIILVDELPVFIQALNDRDGATSISQFLYWLRGIRQKYKNIRWLYTGSIGLDTVARRYNVEGALNDLDPFTLEPFSEETARAFLSDIAKRRGCTFEREAIDTILSRLGWLSPYYLERIAEDACVDRVSNSPIESHDVEATMDRFLDLGKRLYWASWREHLDRNFAEPDRGHLYAILEIVAQNHDGTDGNLIIGHLNQGGEPLGKVELRTLIDTLLSDGYLTQRDNDQYHFRMNLLREWWLRYVIL
jgi:hypothetical protein